VSAKKRAKSAETRKDGLALRSARYANVGREPHLTVELERQLIALAETGLTHKSICRICEIPKSTLYLWLSRGKGDDAPQPYRRFRSRFRAAKSVLEGKLAGVVIENAMLGDWKAASWLLERRFRERYRKREGVYVGPNADEMERERIEATMRKRGYVVVRAGEDPDRLKGDDLKWFQQEVASIELLGTAARGGYEHLNALLASHGLEVREREPQPLPPLLAEQWSTLRRQHTDEEFDRLFRLMAKRAPDMVHRLSDILGELRAEESQDEPDNLYDGAVAIARRTYGTSVADLSSELHIDEPRAKRIIAAMVKAGVLAANSTKGWHNYIAPPPKEQ